MPPHSLEIKYESSSFGDPCKMGSLFAVGIQVSIPPPETPDIDFDLKNLGSFFKLSQKTGFSKKKCREFFRLWSNFTKEDMTKGPFTVWMGKIGFPDKNIVKRLFDIFDLDGGGEIDFEECCLGLSYIMPRDNHHISLERSDMKFYEICFKLLDTDCDGEISMFEFFNTVQSAARLGPQKVIHVHIW